MRIARSGPVLSSSCFVPPLPWSVLLPRCQRIESCRCLRHLILKRNCSLLRANNNSLPLTFGGFLETFIQLLSTGLSVVREDLRKLTLCDSSSETIWLLTNSFFSLSLSCLKKNLMFQSLVPLFLHFLPFVLDNDSEYLEILAPS